MNSDDYDDPQLEGRWLTEQRDIVRRYLQKEDVRHQGIAAEPQWFVAPYVAIWIVESTRHPDAVGLWAISGDLPTDYMSGDDAIDARAALTAFAARWREVSAYMLRDEDHPNIKIGRSDNRKELGDLLNRRAEIIQEFADDDQMWQPMA
jgi:hypothetical protein